MNCQLGVVKGPPEGQSMFVRGEKIFLKLET